MAVTRSEFFPGKGTPGNGGRERSCLGFGPSFGPPKWATLLVTLITGPAPAATAAAGGRILEYCRVKTQRLRLRFVLHISSSSACELKLTLYWVTFLGTTKQALICPSYKCMMSPMGWNWACCPFVSPFFRLDLLTFVSPFLKLGLLSFCYMSPTSQSLQDMWMRLTVALAPHLFYSFFFFFFF